MIHVLTDTFFQPDQGAATNLHHIISKLEEFDDIRERSARMSSVRTLHIDIPRSQNKMLRGRLASSRRGDSRFMCIILDRGNRRNQYPLSQRNLPRG